MSTVAMSSVSVLNVYDGVGISSSIVDYAVSSSGTTPPGNPITDGQGNPIVSNDGKPLTDGSWNTVIPSVQQGQYLWTRTRLIHDDGTFDMIYNVSYSGENGAAGSDGASITASKEQWYLSTSNSSITGGSWSYTEPSEIPDGKYLWGRWEFTMSDGTTQYSDAVYRSVIGGLVNLTDEVNQKISQKIWSSDITNSINTYDNTTGAAIRDRVTATETSISGINTTISDVQTTLSTKADGSTVTNLSSQVNTISDTVADHTQSISATNTRIDNLKLGTKNYIQNSEILDKTKTPYTSTTATPYTSSGMKDGSTAYNTGSGGKIIVTFPQLVSGKEYVFSFDWNRPYTAQTIRTTIGGTNYDETTVNDAVWHRKEIKFTANANTTEAQIYINYSGASYTLYVRHFQLELGNIASDWHESPEDVEAEITSVKTTAEQTADHLSWVIEESGKTASTFTFKSRVMSLINADLVIKDPAGSSTIISGGKINANSITTNMLASNAIKSINYISGSSTDVPDVVSQDIPARYSTTGTFLDLSSGALYMPNFNVDSSGQVFMNGTVYANAGQIGDPGNAYWEIGTIYDDDWGDHAGLIAHGDAIIQADKLTLSDNRLNSENQGNYIAYNNKWYDFGFQVPDFTTNNTHRDNVFYIRSINFQPTSATLDSDWTYLFRVDKNGDIFWNGHDISQGTFVPLSGGVTMTGSLTVPTLTVTGTLTGTASAAQKLTPGKTIQTNLASTSAVTFTGENNVTPGVTGTLGVENGGTGKASWTQWGIVYASTTTALSQVGAGTSGQVLKSNGSAAPGWVNQSSIAAGTATQWASAQTVYVALGTASTTTAIQGGSSTAQTIGVNGTLGVGNGGTGATTFTSGAALIGNGTGAIQTRSIRNNTTAGALGWTANTTDTTLVTTNTIAYWDGRYQTTNNASNLEYVKLGKLGTVVTHAFDEFITTSGGIIDGSLSVTELTAGNLIVTGAGRFTNGLYGDLIGNATTATQVGNNLKIQLNGGTTEGTNQFTYNGSAVKNINITRSSIGLGNAADKTVDTTISAGSSSANLPTSAAVASFVEGKGYVTSSGVTSVQVQATSPVVSSVNTAQTSTLNTTISLANGYGDTKNPYGTKTANYVLAGPSSGSAAAPTFRALVAADIPSITKSKISDFPTTWALSSITGADDLKAIEALTGTSGMLKKTAANTWALTTVVSGLSITGTNNDVLTVTKSDGTSEDLSINITGQVVTGATVLSDSQGNPISLGSASAPVYFSNGVPVQANTIPTIALNGANTTSASFYAPTGAGTNGYVLKSGGSGAPSWVAQSTLSVGSASSATTATKFSSARSITLTGDVTGSASSNGESGWSITTTVGDNSHNHDTSTIVPLATKTYTGLIGTSSNNAANDSFYFMKLRPVDYTSQWNIHYRVSVTIPNHPEFTASSDVRFYGYGQSAAPAKHIFNTLYNSSSYQPYCFHNFYRLTQAGYNAGLSDAIGIGLRTAHQRTTSGYERTLKVEIISTYNCTAELLDTAIKWANWTNGTTTNYTGLSEYNGYTNGLQEDGDTNADTYDRRYLYSTQLIAGTNGIKMYSIVMQDADGNWQSLTTTSNNNVTHTKNTVGFRPEIIFRYAGAADIASGNLCANNYVYETGQMDFRYASNCGTSLTARKSVYLVGTMNNGYFYLDDAWYAQDLPTTEDGKVYIYWGEAYSNYQISYTATHPIYQYKNGRIVEYVDVTKTDIGLGNVDNTADANKSVNHATTADSATRWSSAQKVYVTLGTASTTTTIQGGSSSAQTIGVNGTLGVGNGGTGQTSAVNACNAFLNALTTGASDPVDADYYISQYVNGGTTTTTYHRRPMSALWNYVNGKAGSVYAKLSGAAFTGAVTGTSFGASSYLAANTGNSSTAGGLSLYGTSAVTSYGIAMRGTSNGGKHGYVQGDWAIYSYMSGSDTRGWILKNATDNVGVASVSGGGHAVFTGSVTVGGNTTNTSGMRMEYDSTLACTNFVFN